MKMRHLPNLLSVSRILISMLLLFLFDNFTAFISFYILAGITDVLDGFIARKLKSASSLGAKLDSIGDFFFYSVLIIYLFKEQKEVVNTYWVFIMVIFSLRMLSIIIGVIKFQKLVMIHTIANKISGILIFFIPIFIMLNIDEIIPIILLVSILASIEEIIMNLTGKKGKIRLNRKSIFLNN